MAKVDLENAFHQLALHPECGKLLGMQLAEGGDMYVPKRAVFKGKSSPHLMNSFMAEVKQILDARGIKVVYLTDDIYIRGATYICRP